ncbi:MULTISPECIES: phage tail tape measure protein [Bizionia]|uniref:Phage tail tape measure protein n=1 Tax=Bizionia algoritergicola TaxID=291187 RepID=A0A5D0QZB1_9FLAO|nr:MULTISPECIES: phage tail tape measure protein [Bizionia]OBX20959.1 phage tail tape measure protein [Bizionia sp. APA-3]TYB74590.1 phage tail tape measure protein [Bizionia algoritergicola]
MDNTLNYILKFQSDADKVAASVERLDKGLNDVNQHVGVMGNKFSSALDKVNSKLSGMRINAFVQNVQSASQGLDSMSAPGLKLSTSLADLSAITDVTGNKLKEIEGYARTSAKTFGGDAADGVEAYKLILSQLTPELAQAPKALQNMGVHIQTLSKTMGGDVAAASEVLTTAMNQYQVSTDDPIKASAEMGNMMNIMAAGAKEGSAELPQIKQALEQSGMAAKTAGVHFAETNGYIQVLDKAGKKGSEGGVALRNVMASLSQGRFLPKDVQKELQMAGVDINTLTDKSLTLSDRLKPLRGIMHDQALVTKMFGKENSNAAIAMLSGIDEAERLTTAIQGTNTAYEQAAIVMDSPAEKAGRFRAKIDDLKISMFNATGGTLAYAAELGSMAFDISNLIPLFSGFGQAISFVTNATKMQALWTSITSGATSVWTGIQWGLNAAMNANPIGIIVLAVAALAAGIGWVISKTEGWGQAWEHTVSGGKLLFKLFGDFIKLEFLTVVNGLMIGLNFIKKGWYEFKEAVGLGDSTENQRMISQINADTESRKQAIIDQAKEVKQTAFDAAMEFGKAANSIKWKTEVEEGEASGVGISDPTAPGAISGNGSGSGNTAGSGAGAKTNKAIATGGTKHNYITISLESLIGALTIKGNDFKDSAKQLETQSVDALVRTLALATTAGS